MYPGVYSNGSETSSFKIKFAIFVDFLNIAGVMVHYLRKFYSSANQGTSKTHILIALSSFNGGITIKSSIL